MKPLNLSVCVRVHVGVCVCVCACHSCERCSARVSLSVFQERPHVSRCDASLAARWSGGGR